MNAGHLAETETPRLRTVEVPVLSRAIEKLGVC